MKYLNYILILFLLLLSSCSSWKGVLVSSGDQNDAVRNAIYDFINTERLSKKDNVFSVGVIDTLSDTVLGIYVIGNENTQLVITKDGTEFSYRAFPTRYLELDGKLFYWYDAAETVSDDLIDTFTRYSLIDTMIVNVYIPERIIDDSKKGVDYYFCKNNFLKYKKVRGTIAMGWYDPPRLRCETSN
jgi:hypothetical protein